MKSNRISKRFIRSPLFPVDVNVPIGLKEYHKNFLTNFFGFKIKDDDNKGFFTVVDFNGFKKVSVGVQDWFYLIDKKGRKRAAIYFKIVEDNKAVSYINYMTRYRVKIDHEIPFNMYKERNQPTDHFNSPVTGVVLDSEENVLFSITPQTIPVSYRTEGYNEAVLKIKNSAYETCKEWLDKTFTNWDDISKYWED